MLNSFLIRDVVQLALAEDLGTGDVTSWSIFPPEHLSRASFVVKEPAILCGMPIVEEVFAQLGSIQYTALHKDGDKLTPFSAVAEVTGPTRVLLSGERVALNFMQRMSGIATLTARYVAEIAGTKVRIVDTRKTTPGLRILEKYAVRTGGGTNHRIGLYDAVMIKDNHVAAAGGIRAAIALVKKGATFLMPIEVEVTSAAEALEAVEAGADVVMLDNMTLEDMTEAVKMVNGRALIEASGGVTLDRVKAIAATGVDVISVGALTHSAPAIDIHMKITEVVSS